MTVAQRLDEMTGHLSGFLSGTEQSQPSLDQLSGENFDVRCCDLLPQPEPVVEVTPVVKAPEDYAPVPEVNHETPVNKGALSDPSDPFDSESEKVESVPMDSTNAQPVTQPAENLPAETANDDGGNMQEEMNTDKQPKWNELEGDSDDDNGEEDDDRAVT